MSVREIREIRKMYLLSSKSLLLLSYHTGVMSLYVSHTLSPANVIYRYVIIEAKGECRKYVFCLGKIM